MSILLHGDCLEEMKGLEDNSIDLIFCDLPYGQTSCKWDCCIDLEKFWIEVMRIKKLNTPIFMTTTTKFGVSLINSAPKKCPFRYDIVWVKSSCAGFLSAKKMPMRKHEMVYVFYEKLPFYDLSSHKHKFIKHKEGQIKPPTKSDNSPYGGEASRKKQLKLCVGGQAGSYDPPLPVSVVKEELCKYDVNKNTYGGGKEGRIKISKDKKDHQQKYDPPLPVSVIKEELAEGQTLGDKGNECYGKFSYYNNGVKGYDPPLPVSIVKEEMTGGATGEEPKYVGKPVMRKDTTYGDITSYEIKERKNGESRYEPPLPVSVVKEDIRKDKHTTAYGDNIHYHNNQQRNGESIYDPPLPNSMLEIKSSRGKHSTEKPVALMEWILKYYSKEGDVVLDPTMGSGSTGVACKNMNRNFIGIEMDDEIYEVAVNRIED